MDSKIYSAYKTVIENNNPNAGIDEDEESRINILNDIATGLKDILDKIENYTSKSPSGERIKLPENPEDFSWIRSSQQ